MKPTPVKCAAVNAILGINETAAQREFLAELNAKGLRLVKRGDQFRIEEAQANAKDRLERFHDGANEYACAHTGSIIRIYRVGDAFRVCRRCHALVEYEEGRLTIDCPHDVTVPLRAFTMQDPVRVCTLCGTKLST